MTYFNEKQIEFLKGLARQIANERDSLDPDDDSLYRSALNRLLLEVDGRIALGQTESVPETDAERQVSRYHAIRRRSV